MVVPTSAPGYIDPREFLKPDEDHVPGTEWRTPKKAALREAWRCELQFTPSRRRSKRKLFKDYGVPERTGFRLLKGLTSERTGKITRPGARHKLSFIKTTFILLWITFCFARRALPYTQVILELNLPVSKWTLQRALEARGYYRCKACWGRYIKPVSKSNRKNWASDHDSWGLKDWQLVHFSDETHFAVGQENHMWVTRHHDERHEPDCVQYKSQRNPTTLHFWAAVGWNFKTDLDLYWNEEGAGNLTMDTYIKVLKRTYLPRLKEHQNLYSQDKPWILEEDNDSAHGHASKRNKVKTFKAQYGIRCYNNCPYSPDLSIIESVWRMLKQRVRKHRCRSEKELIDAIYYEWNKITYVEINKLVEEMEARIDAVLDAEGAPTQY